LKAMLAQGFDRRDGELLGHAPPGGLKPL
jgi:hypothetical protein